jgi:hypothetical protein
MSDVKPDPESAGAAATDAADAAADEPAAKRVKREEQEQQQQAAAQLEPDIKQQDGIAKQEDGQQQQQQQDDDDDEEDDERIPLPLSTTRSAVKRGHECPYLDTILRQVSSQLPSQAAGWQAKPVSRAAASKSSGSLCTSLVMCARSFDFLLSRLQHI